ncbi:hypothetical protein [Leucobacter luti]|uniref:Uncharacterized protein n=1 Tax=Leucobacter luti TaxID=340320 RepID=A0A4Q7TIF5_9MICO|nr:hypothetical protein [Leucobacter luti]MBL3699656.1 hypothetical protein [Leucobacter luti]RZT59430.1 hypothetical protein EV139_3102 [Leucobacter luti]
MNSNPLVPDTTLVLVLWIVLWLLGVIVTLWILWAIIRGAVLSALRKHSAEQAEAQRHHGLPR